MTMFVVKSIHIQINGQVIDLSIRIAPQTMDRVKIILQVVCGDTIFIDIDSAAFQRTI